MINYLNLLVKKIRGRIKLAPLAVCEISGKNALTEYREKKFDKQSEIIISGVKM